jgi:hypothetical protein
MFSALSASQTAAFEAVIHQLSPEDRRQLDILAGPAAEAACAASRTGAFGASAEAVDALLDPGRGGDVRRGLIAAWALALPDRVAGQNLPPEITGNYPEWMDRLALFLTETAGDYDADFWAKDVRFALALSVPSTRTQVIDLQSRLGPGDVVRHARGGRGWDVIAAYAAARGWGPWLEVHTEARDLTDFNEAGWDKAWTAAAAILRRRPELRGIIGSSWFYDPPLEVISPKLAYLRLNPTRNGAFLIHQGPGEIHTERAAASPGSRRAMIESGKYLPRSWIVAWPRAALLRWADARIETAQAA